jgi:hypothetical protein
MQPTIFPSTTIKQLIPITPYLPNADALMYSAESLKNHKPGILNKLIQNCNKEKVVEQNHLALVKLLPSTIKVKVDIQMLNKFSDGVPVSVRFLQPQTTGNIYLNEGLGVFSSCPITLVNIC